METKQQKPKPEEQAPVFNADGSYSFTCRWCNEEVILQPDEVQWYQERGYAMPTRCRACRRKRRGIMQARSANAPAEVVEG